MAPYRINSSLVHLSKSYKFDFRVALMSLRNVRTGHFKVTVSDLLTSCSSIVGNLAALVDSDLVSCYFVVIFVLL